MEAGAATTQKKPTKRAAKKPAARASAVPDVDVPAGLGAAGAALWRRLLANYEFSAEHELVLVELACRQADDLAALEQAVCDAGVMVVGSQGQPRLNAAVIE